MSTDATSMIELPSRGAFADWAGMIASIGCAIHCASMPLVLAYLPSLGLGWLAEEGFHRWMAVICFVLAAAAFVPGWRKHGSFLPAVWGGIGLMMLTTAAFAFEGSCCASCASSDAVASVGADSSGGVSLSATPTEAHCEFCLAAESGEATTSAFSFTGASLIPFVTPLGGLFLVVGHIVNHRKSCVCQGNSCCLSEGDEFHTLESQ